MSHLPCIIFKAEPLLHAAVRFDQLTCSRMVISPHEVGAEAGVWCPRNMIISLLSEAVGLGPCPGVRTPLKTTGQLFWLWSTTCEGPVLSMVISTIWKFLQVAGPSSCRIKDLSRTFIGYVISTRYEDS